MSVQYHLQQPESTADQYLPFQGIDFVLSTPGRKLVANSVRIEGRIVARTNTTDPYTPATAGDASSAVDYDSNVKIDNIVGAHSFFDSFTCETQTKGVLENLQNYPRFVANMDEQHTRQMICSVLNF